QPRQFVLYLQCRDRILSRPVSSAAHFPPAPPFLPCLPYLPDRTSFRSVRSLSVTADVYSSPPQVQRCSTGGLSQPRPRQRVSEHRLHPNPEQWRFPRVSVSPLSTSQSYRKLPIGSLRPFPVSERL